jgi:hypothetical protein
MSFAGCLFTRGHHCLCDDARVKRPNPGLSECSTDGIGVHRAKVSSSVYADEIGFIDLSSSFALVPIALDGLLQNTKYDYIKTLQDMGGMRRIADHQDLVHTSIFKEPMGIV